MLNFTYHNPVKIVFGKGSMAELANLLDKNWKILMTYGGGSIKRNGVYDQVKAALSDRVVVEFGGIEPNPLYETCMRAVDVVKKENIDFLLSVGGGSCLDATKFIAAAAKYAKEDPWDILAAGEPVEDAMPLGDVLTLPATGSEMNGNSVISRESTNEKLAFTSEKVYPVFSILDPEATFSLPERQTVNGVVDAFVHVFEQYMTYDVNAPLQDRQAEAVLSTLMEVGPKVLKNPNDYDARANVMWAATNALNGLLGCGVPQDWATHMIGHELTAFYGLDHARSLAIVLPSLLRHEKDNKRDKLLKYARRVLSIDESDEDKAIERAINETASFFNSLGAKTKLSDCDIAAKEAAAKVGDRLEERGLTYGEHQSIAAPEIREILLNC